MSQSTLPPKELVNEGVMRAKNMGVALFMICFLLTKYVVVKVIWQPTERVMARGLIALAVRLSAWYIKLEPRWRAFKQRVSETRNRVVRISLGLMIMALTPLENLMVRSFGIAKQRSEHLATQGASRAVNALLPLLATLGQAIRAGFSKPAIQRLLQKLVVILDDAQP